MASGSCTLSDQLLVAVLQLLNKDVSEHGRHLTQYFHLFNLYASLGPPEKLQLLKVFDLQFFFSFFNVICAFQLNFSHMLIPGRMTFIQRVDLFLNSTLFI